MRLVEQQPRRLFEFRRDALALRGLGQRHDRGMARIDLEHWRADRDAGRLLARQEALHRAVEARVGDEADRTGGEARRFAHILNLIAERLLDDGDQRAGRRVVDIGFSRLFDQWNLVEIGGALA